MRGISHIGVLKALETLGIQYDAIVGTSIGALIGAMAAGGMPIDSIEAHVAALEKTDYFRPNFLKFLLKGTRARSMYRGETFRESHVNQSSRRGQIEGDEPAGKQRDDPAGIEQKRSFIRVSANPNERFFRGELLPFLIGLGRRTSAQGGQRCAATLR